jgi:WD40-like Beta Propeller Repeat
MVNWGESMIRNSVCGVLALVFTWVCATQAHAGVDAWSPHNISSPAFESHAAFDPVAKDLYFVRSSPSFEGWRIVVSHCAKSGWLPARPPAFAGDGVEADPFFTRDGGSLYFISTRTTDGIKRSDLDIWRVDRDAHRRWGTPIRLPAPINSDANEWFPRIGPDGWLYFGSAREGGLGKTDIWRGRQDDAGKWKIENLGPAINSAADEYEALPSPDGNRLIINAADGFFESRRQADGSWGPRQRMDAGINANGSEVGALFSPSGHSMLFSRDTKQALSGEFFLSNDGTAESWPPVCAAPAS